MKAEAFGYHRATSVDEASQLLLAYDGNARILAGGQSLVPMLNMRIIRPDALIDVNRIDALQQIDVQRGQIQLGAVVRYAQIESSIDILKRIPLLKMVVPHIGDLQIRNRGTIGGSIVHADPTGEMPLACLTLDAYVDLAGPAGIRRVPLTSFYEGSYATAMQPCEVLTRVVFTREWQHAVFTELCRRHNDFALVAVAIVADRDEAGFYRNIRIGLGGVHPTPVLIQRAMSIVEGSKLEGDVIRDAALAAVEEIDPPSDVRGSALYRRSLTSVYLKRALLTLRTASCQREGR